MWRERSSERDVSSEENIHVALERPGKNRLPVGSSKLARASRFVLLAVLATGWPAGPSTHAAAPARGDVPLVYNKGRNFRIPFNLNTEERSRIKEVFLAVSEDSGYSWKSVSRTFPDHPTFTYRATHDGEFWFAVQTRTTDGKISPKLDSAVEAKMKVVVDTFPPLLTLEPDERRGSMAAVRWEMKDENLDAKTLLIEYQIAGSGSWRKVPIKKLKLMGSQNWDSGTAEALEVRASVADLAGNISEAKINLGEGTPNPPEMSPDDQDPLGPSQNSRISNGAESEIMAGPDFTPVNAAPTRNSRRPVNEDLAPGNDDPPPTRPAAAARSTAKARSRPDDPSPAGPKSASPAWDRNNDTRVFRIPGSGAPASNDLFAAANAAASLESAPTRSRSGTTATADGTTKRESAPAGSGGSLLVANPKFKLAYAIEDAGPTGPALVEIWITQDGGRTWIRRGEDPDRVTPIDVDLGGEGTFGVSLVARSASGLGDQPPAPGDPPQTWVEVDATPPAVQLEPVQIGTGANSGKVAISWRASDLHLAQKSVSLLWRPDKPGASWQPLAENQDNAGQYIWTVPPSVPTRFHLRVEAVDTIGHRGGAETTDSGPIIVDRSRPRSRIIGLDTNARAGTGSGSWPLR
jgi:hypothetical protein